MLGEEQRCETDKGAYQDKHVVRDDAEHHVHLTDRSGLAGILIAPRKPHRKA